MTDGKDGAAARRAVRVVFVALLVDLLAFTMPLPLFPRIIEGFVEQEARHPFGSPTLLSRTLDAVRSIRAYLFSFSSLRTVTDSRWDLTLLGGLLASLFSTCQFLVSPRLGKLSDRYGRRPVLLATMVGNLLSALLWLFADNFALYAASRIVGGLAEGNVQLSIAIITDITSPEARARSLALVGAAFSLAFTLGPSLGAYLSGRTFGRGSVVTLPGGSKEIRLNSYAVPAAMTVALLAFETIYLWLRLPETRGWSGAANSTTSTNGTSPTTTSDAKPARPRRSISERRARLRRLERIHLAFLFFFSGAEFTLTFLTHNLFDWSNVQNGRLLGFIGILSALLQGGYVRRKSKNATAAQTGRLAQSGIRACMLSLIALAVLPRVDKGSKAASVLLWTAAAGLAFVSATVVNSLNALASLETDEPVPTPNGPSSASSTPASATLDRIDKGAALGSFRSQGQLGRAVGPLVTTAIYWTVSPSMAYLVCALGTVGVVAAMGRIVEEDRRGEDSSATQGKKSE
ncbi:hypothetical protein JCM10908_006939 [Rhodotorula pacifica]|uniref:uncharacterized protein n=1 Tax=Rhodotorula pacifica TaxID=1495444 RepID=UPI0031710E53